MLQKNSYIFLRNSDYEKPCTDIYIDLLSINFNLLFVLLYSAYHQISDKEIDTEVIKNMVAMDTLFFQISISVVSDNILSIYIREPRLILRKFIVLLHSISAYNSLLVRYKVYSSDLRE